MPLRLFNLQLEFAGSELPPEPQIMLANQPRDRRTARSGVTPSVVVALKPDQLSTWPPDTVAWILERSDDGGQSYADVSGLITDGPLYTDRPGPGSFRYRAKSRTALGVVSAEGNEIEVFVGDYSTYEDGAINECDADTGALLTRMDKALAFPNGLGEPSLGMGACEGSLAGSFGDGAWYVEPGEVEPPISINEVPACGSVDIGFPLNQITYTLQDQPFPGGSGINDASIRIALQVTSQNGGSPRLVWDGVTSPWAPDVSVVISPGGDPLLERDVVVTLDPAYIQPNDVVVIATYVEDNDGNGATIECSFVMEDQDTDPPIIDQQDPECGSGLLSNDDRRAPRNTPFSFRVVDNDSGVDMATLQVFFGPTSSGPWTQVIQNGATFLGGFFGNITALTGVDQGFAVQINRPVADPLWGADEQVCFRVNVSDNQGNAAEDICCFRTEDAAKIRNVIVLAEGLLFVEFTVPMQRGDDPLKNVENYAITDVDSGEEVRVMQVEPQKFFFEEQMVDNPRMVQGDGDPLYVVLRTRAHTHWSRYNLTVDNLLDYNGLPMALDGRVGSYIGRSTKFDTGTNGVELMGVADDDNLLRNMLVALLFGQEQIGGTFVDDDWEAGS